MHLLSHLLALLLLMIAPASADPLGAPLIVTAVKSGDTLVLNDGRTVRLYGILAANDGAQKQLQELAIGKNVVLRPAPTPQDQHGKTLAEVILPNNKILQEELLKSGNAHVYTTADNPKIATQFYPLEREARAAKRGIWASPVIVTSDNAYKYMGSFRIIEGTVKAVATVNGTTYLNFGDDWRRDFTAMLDSKTAKALGAESLKDKRVRVRGWVYSRNGPMITVGHAEQIETAE